MISWYQNIPLHIDPIVFTVGSFSVRWYALSYLVGFGVVYGLLIWRMKCECETPDFRRPTSAAVLDSLSVAFFSALLGGRLGYVLFYDLAFFWSHPAAIFLPYDPGSGKFNGFYGMSYHGALIGILVGSWIFSHVRKIDFWKWADFVVPAAPLGYFFGRLGNFINGELYGRVTGSFLGMHFAGDQTVLRHPSQIYEAVLEGLLLFAILWKMRKRRLPDGTLLVIYLIGYGLLRILGEMFRQPDPQIGFVWGYFTMGQILSAAMIICGMSVAAFSKKRKSGIIGKV